MSINWLQRVGDWNPQLFREIKGRLQVRNIAIAAASSLLFQLLLLVFGLGNPTLNLIEPIQTITLATLPSFSSLTSESITGNGSTSPSGQGLLASSYLFWSTTL